MKLANQSAFPVPDVEYGLTKRELFAAMFMHAHIVGNLAAANVDVEVDAAIDFAKGALYAADVLIKKLGGEE